LASSSGFISRRNQKIMKERVQRLLKKIAEAIKEARAAGVRDPQGLSKKALESRKEYKTYKSNYNK
jgi:hypothetical protein